MTILVADVLLVGFLTYLTLLLGSHFSVKSRLLGLKEPRDSGFSFVLGRADRGSAMATEHRVLGVH